MIDPETDPTWRRWDEVSRIFESALDRPPDEREAFVADACRGDSELLVAVRDLLEALDASDGMFDTPGTELVGAALSEGTGGEGADPESRPGLEAGSRVGRYEIVGEIGRGGMATVYEAERADGTFERRVALKVLRRGLDTEEVVRRFLGERQILSGLSHPNIARLIDGGATGDGRPYLVMERVDGIPCTEWADERRLTVEQRLDLFLQLADAVHFAHRRLVVHRDLKPSNVLVDDEGRAHLLDFGIAKLVDPGPGADVLTGADGPRPLTPAFASPEQLRGEVVTTASDVYQLGVLLHLLLTGRRPEGAGEGSDTGSTSRFRPSEVVGRGGTVEEGTGETGAVSGLSPREIARARRTTLPALRTTLKGDLDTIVLKALRPEPDERYPSAEALATDLRHHLAGRPIAARPPSAMYRFRKLHGRNPWLVPLVAGLLLAVGSYVFTVVRHAGELERERNEARAAAERADQLRSFVVDVFRTGDPYETPDPARGREITVVEALEVGAERVRDELAGRPELQAAVLGTIADVYLNLDDSESAGPLLREAFELHERSGAGLTPDFASILAGLVRVANRTVGRDSAAAVARRRLGAEIDLHGPEHPRVAEALSNLADQVSHLGRHDEALRNREEAVRILRAAGGAGRDALASTLAMLADGYRTGGRLEEARAAAREAFDIHLELRGPEHPSTAQQRIHLAQVLHAMGRLEDAAAAYREALPVLERTLGRDHFITQNSWNNLAIVLSGMGAYREAEDVHRRVLAHRAGPEGDVRDRDVAGSLQNLAAVLLRQERYAEADSLASEAYHIYRDQAPPGSHLPALPLLSQAEIRLVSGDPAGAEVASRTAVEILSPALPDGHYVTAMAECRLGLALARQGRVETGAALVESALEEVRAWEGTPDRLVTECSEASAEVARRVTSG